MMDGIYKYYTVNAEQQYSVFSLWHFNNNSAEQRKNSYYYSTTTVTIAKFSNPNLQQLGCYTEILISSTLVSSPHTSSFERAQCHVLQNLQHQLH